MAYSPASNLVSNLPQASVTYYEKEFFENLKANTPFPRLCTRKELPLNSGNKMEMFMYTALGANTTQATEGTVGTGISVAVQDVTATIGEYADFSTFSSLSLATAIDPVVENVEREFAYRLGQSLSAIVRATIDGLYTIDASVQVQLAASSLASFTALTNGALRNACFSLAGRNVKPLDEGSGNFGGVIHPFALGDVELDTSNNSPIDILKHTPQGLLKLDNLGSIDAAEVVEFPSTPISFFKSNLVTTTSNYKGITGLTALRTYILGKDGCIAIDLKANGDTSINDGEWQTLKCNVMQNAPISVADPAGMIPGWTSYKVHFTTSAPPDTVMRARTIDAASNVS